MSASQIQELYRVEVLDSPVDTTFTAKQLLDDQSVLKDESLKDLKFRVRFANIDLGEANIVSLEKDLSLLESIHGDFENVQLYTDFVEWLGYLPDTSDDENHPYDISGYDGSVSEEKALNFLVE